MSDLPHHTPAFVFRVIPVGASDGFLVQEVTGLATALDVQTVQEGGENRFDHQLPRTAEQANVVIRRGVLPRSDPTAVWIRDVLEDSLGKPITPGNVAIDLIDPEGQTRASWLLTHAYPVKLSVGTFETEKDELAIEALEIAYGSLTRRL
ncbi:phage tail protein [uncultured Tateyamaria sp.]|uniref:phage tail protein n=1 Tax=uncultured Tateyamaria sp. TaxID=455651 RepID=UPI002634E51F|nr:phage tail protein [uncultured Tateyamaria sp.]